MTLKPPRMLLALALAALLATFGCSDDADPAVDAGPAADHAVHGDGGEDTDAEACTHLKGGPFVDVTPGSDLKTAGEVGSDHKAYRVALTAGSAGFVKYAVAKKGELRVYLDAAVTLSAQDDQGAAITPEKTETSITACTTVKSKVTLDLDGAGTVYLGLGPATAAAKVTMVLELGDHHDH